MDISVFRGCNLGLIACGVFLSFISDPAHAAGVSAPSNPAEVATEYKAQRQANFLLADYEDELLECSALAAVHLWIGDNLGDDPGAEVRKALASDYWVGVSKNYLSLAQEATGGADLSKELGVRMRALGAEFRRLTEAESGAADWAGWHDLVDRCDAWRSESPTHSFFNNGRDQVAEKVQAEEVAMAAE